MKKYIISFITLLLSQAAFAQDSNGNRKGIERIAAMQHQQVLQRVTDLTTGQKASLQDIFNEFGKELTSLQKENGRQKLILFQTINNHKDSRVKSVLTKVQAKKYEELTEEWKKKMQQRKKRNR